MTQLRVTTGRCRVKIVYFVQQVTTVEWDAFINIRTIRSQIDAI